MVIPEPPPYASSVGREGSGERLAISSNASSRGGSSQAPGEHAAIRRAVSMRSSIKAAANAAEAPTPLPVAKRNRVPRSRMKISGSKFSPNSGDTASRTLGSANDPKARETPCQMESRVRESES
ncbi:MAG: hypothetical protein LKI78_05005 [Bifidobacterium tibiigranuli]|nr:hypothetical protein [Bifidobacterium tibiigranuli]MCI1834175.1 hypothetical protein [Bifidobacterium tibiigranuli]